MKKCCICGEEIIGWGNNPNGAVCITSDKEVKLMEFNEDDRCCDQCNRDYVIPGRLYRLKQHSAEDMVI